MKRSAEPLEEGASDRRRSSAGNAIDVPGQAPTGRINETASDDNSTNEQSANNNEGTNNDESTSNNTAITLPPFISSQIPQNLHPVGKIVAQSETRGNISQAARLVVTIETYLTDLYRCEGLYLELKAIDDTQAVPRRGVMLGVTPILNDELFSNASLVEMQASTNGRMLLKDFVVIPRQVVGHIPAWFVAHLRRQNALPLRVALEAHPEVSCHYYGYEETARETNDMWTHEISQHLVGGRVFVCTNDVGLRRLWINE